jgi:hypothetical protein
MPYGSDTWVLDHVPVLSWRHALVIEYGELGNRAAAIERRVRRLTSQADAVVGCLVHVTCLPRWDVLPLTCYPIDTERLQPVPPRKEGPIRIAHAANHCGAKGTEFLVAAVERLRAEGTDADVTLIEKRPNQEALEQIAGADIYVDQLVFAYALAALEGIALGKVVVSALEDSPRVRPLPPLFLPWGVPDRPRDGGHDRLRPSRPDRAPERVACAWPPEPRLRGSPAFLGGLPRALRGDLRSHLAR